MPTDDPQRPPTDADQAWLDGLAGRAKAAGDAVPGAAAQDHHEQGRRLRAALVETPAPGQAPGVLQPSDDGWQALLQRAHPEPAANETTQPKPAPPARPARWAGAPAWAAAAGVAALAVLWGLGPRPAEDPDAPPGPGTRGDAALRGDGSTRPADPARWRSAHPAQEAGLLAAELRAAGAQVQMQPQATGGGLLLDINAEPAARAAANAVLAPLETALGADGRLQLLVLPPPPAGAGSKP